LIKSASPVIAIAAKQTGMVPTGGGEIFGRE